MKTDKKTCENCRFFGDMMAEKSLNCKALSNWQRNPKMWLSIPPEEPGWYWLKEGGREIQIVEVVIGHSHVYRSGTECFDELKEVHGEWQGPIRPEI